MIEECVAAVTKREVATFVVTGINIVFRGSTKDDVKAVASCDCIVASMFCAERADFAENSLSEDRIEQNIAVIAYGHIATGIGAGVNVVIIPTTKDNVKTVSGTDCICAAKGGIGAV